MPRRDPRVTLREILDALRKAQQIHDTHIRPELERLLTDGV